ncbi:MAG: hypothetical protein AAB421_01740 [Patescibacteria group bacterium]
MAKDKLGHHKGKPAPWEALPGDKLLLSGHIPAQDNMSTAEILRLEMYPAFSRIEKDHSYTSLALRDGTGLCMSCSCHPRDTHFGRFRLCYEHRFRLISYAAIEFISPIRFEPQGGTLVKLETLRKNHSYVTALVTDVPARQKQ